eukprot:15451003-Alexandrium_andersonii.AAC.1
MRNAASDSARKCLEHFRALSVGFGRFRALSGFAPNCPKLTENARRRPKVLESVPGTFGHFRAVSEAVL